MKIRSKLIEGFNSSKKNYVIFGIILNLLMAGTQIFIQISFADQNKKATLINYAGRQRMLSQKIAKLALQYENTRHDSLFNELEYQAKNWNHIHRALQSGNEELGIIKLSNHKVDSLFYLMNPHQKAIMQSIALLKSSPNDDTTIKSSVDSILKNESTFLVNMNLAVNQYELDVYRSTENIDMLIMIAGLTIFLLFFFVFRPAYNLLLDQNREIGENYKNVEALNEELKASEEELSGYLEKLNGQNEELKIAKDKAEESNYAKAQFLSTMSHELRTPLNAVIGIANLLEDDLPAFQRQENIKSLKFSSENLLYLVNNILDFSKIEAGKVDLDYKTVEIKPLLQNVVNSLSFSAKEKGIYLTLETDPEIPQHLELDPSRFTQIINNLISNAIKFTEKGGVHVSVNKCSVDDYCEFEVVVNDTGIGIEDEVQSKIFDVFSQAEASTSRKYGGSGLGLAISKKLLSLMKSEITLNSKKGQGSTFSFKIKAKIANVMGRKEFITRSNTPSLAGKRILVAEDNRMNVLVISQFLKKWKIEHHIAGNGIEAIEAIKTSSFDLILMDMQMPEMDGIQASYRIRALGHELPIIALSASATHEIRNEATEAGIDDFATKPFKPDDLYDKLCLHLLSKEEV